MTNTYLGSLKIRKRWLIIPSFLGIIAVIFYSMVTQPIPYFAEIDLSELANYKYIDAYRSWSGDGWKLGHWREPKPAFSRDITHLILQTQNGAFDLVHFSSTDKQGSTFWDADVIGNTLYVHQDRSFAPSNWIHLDVLVHGWWRQTFTDQPLGGWKIISPPSNCCSPAQARRRPPGRC